jgi:hypothetical protein
MKTSQKHETTNGRPWASFLAIAVLLAATVTPTWAGKGNPAILPPHSNPQGQSYAEWAAEYWNWYWPMPYEYYDVNFFEMSGNVCLVTGSALGESERILTLPTGTMLFLPVYTCASADFPETWDQPYVDPVTEVEYTSEEDWSVWFCDQVVNAVTVRCQIDGREVRNLQSYRVHTPFGGGYPEGNWLGVEPGTEYVGLADGLFLMLAPLATGTHTIQYWSSLPERFWPYFGFESGEATTLFHITVKGKHGEKGECEQEDAHGDKGDHKR